MEVTQKRLAFVGLHGGVFEAMQPFAAPLGLTCDYVTDEAIAAEEVDFGEYDVIFLQHTRDENRAQYQRLLKAAKEVNPQLRVFSLSGIAEKDLPELAKSGMVESDPDLSRYYGSTPENLRRMLIYISTTYLGKSGAVIAPEEADTMAGLYHPDHDGMFSNTGEYLRWARESGRDVENLPRFIVAVHGTHLAFQQPAVVAAIIRELELQGGIAVAMVDFGKDYERNVREFKPNAFIHTCHSREAVDWRKEIGVPHLHSIFMRQQPIADWQVSLEGLSSSEMAFHIVGQEVLGAIEPQVAAGTEYGGGGHEAFLPIPDRVRHLAARAIAWAKLGVQSEKDKKVAIIYYDREMGKAELMRGSATGMFMNAPRSMVRILHRLRDEGYRLNRVPANEDELIALMQDRGRQIGIWAPGVLDRLARSGNAVLVPLEQYQTWLEERVPADLQQQIVEKWGPAPGRFLVWENGDQKYIVIPRIDLGNVILLPQPLRGEAHDTSLIHDVRVPPPHNYLATYFWLEKEFGADAMIHFGTHGTEFLLPGKPTGLSGHDWPDIAMGDTPNINPWIINNLGESSPVRRRAYALLIDHLVPPSVAAELSDEMLNLHNDIDKWITLEEGALKEKFREAVTRQYLALHLDQDLQQSPADGKLLAPEQIQKLLAYLHEIHTETTPISLHVFGEPPTNDLLIPWLATCLRSRFLETLGEVIEVPPGEALTDGDRKKYLRARGEEILKLIVEQDFSPLDATLAVGGGVPNDELSDELTEQFELALRLRDGFAQTTMELDQLVNALDGKYIPPGPGASPDRNSAVLPTGRNMYVMNPEEVPTRPSWELGKQLIDDFLQQQRDQTGRYPEKIGFTLNSFATFQDYGVMESQIMYLIGVRPVWDAQNLVVDVELIPAAELGRPRIDVFIASQSYYRDMLPTRLRLIDKAIRMVAELKEASNFLHANSLRVAEELQAKGETPQRAEVLSKARIFGYPQGQMGSAGYYYLVERSGEWDSREELMETYLSHARHVYTDEMWGETAPEVYNRQIQGTEIVMRSWSDRTRSPLSNKYVWYHGGSLCLAVKHLTGKEPQFILTDVRDPDQARMISAEDALRRDFRVRLFNRKWIEGMMKEGYAGADQVSVHVSNAMGWTIMRPGSVSDENWEEIVNVYMRDTKNLAIREWFEAENPFAFQDMTEVLLETIRKGYWNPDDATKREIAQAYAESVALHGEGGGLRGGGNHKLEDFVRLLLQPGASQPMAELLAAYESRITESTVIAEADDAASSSMASPRPTEVAQADKPSEQVEGAKLEPQAEEVVDTPNDAPFPWLAVLTPLVCLILLGAGYMIRRGAPRE
ncbi:cobaltochelatase subunit CobN [Blastopirellula marina]|uniref:Cobalamin biosynthesis protein N n=1 Tax=Blastopirellula marina DSM 3645 TaxID=314230 RepID=A3ZMX2_9BACT|nr:cobaltochelatase subunit CobN [Blastopirellula marina]EAQ82301.1 cobalamin biosynthesis protein N [Blastopirellula marina DSM 3645]